MVTLNFTVQSLQGIAKEELELQVMREQIEKKKKMSSLFSSPTVPSEVKEMLGLEHSKDDNDSRCLTKSVKAGKLTPKRLSKLEEEKKRRLRAVQCHPRVLLRSPNQRKIQMFQQIEKGKSFKVAYNNVLH